jgi:hypothetical protein
MCRGQWTGKKVRLAKLYRIQGGGDMAILVGDRVTDPRSPDRTRKGCVVQVHTNAMCLMRTLEVRWDDDRDHTEEIEEIEFGLLED